MATKYTGTDNIANPSDSLSTNTMQGYDRNLLRRAVENFVIGKFVAKKSNKKYSGKSVVFSVYDQIADTAFTTAVLADGVTPAETDITKKSVKADISNYGAFTVLTDEVSIYHEDGAGLVKETTDNLGAAAGTAIEKLLFAEGYAGAGVDLVTVPAATIKAGLEDAETQLRVNLAPKFKSMITGSTNYATSPIRHAFIGFVHPVDVLELESLGSVSGDEKYVDVSKYGYSKGLIENEVGAYRGIRFIESVNATQGTILVLGEEALAEVGVRGVGRIQTVLKGFASGGTEDALNQRQSVGAKFAVAAKMIRPERAAVIAIPVS